MKTSIKIFLRRHQKRGHEDLLVHIGWDGLSQEDVQKLASFYVLHRIEAELKGWDEKLPESVEYRAADFLYNEPLVNLDVEVPAKWKEPPKSKAQKEFDKAIAELSADELRQLLGEL